jgi:hypothetical protein
VTEGEAEDYNYDTSSLKGVTFNDNTPYIAGDAGRKAYYAHIIVDLAEPGITAQDVTMKSPFAGYILSSSDILKYEDMREVNGLPDWEDIKVQGVYNGYFPCAFNVWYGTPVDARIGQTFTAQVTKTASGEIILINDYILASDRESFTSVSFTLVDKRTEKVFSQVKNVRIDYKLGEQTTVSGDYLTAGAFSGGINVDDRWDGKLDIEF